MVRLILFFYLLLSLSKGIAQSVEIVCKEKWVQPNQEFVIEINFFELEPQNLEWPRDMDLEIIAKSRPSRWTEIINGKRRSGTRVAYKLKAKKQGEIQIGPVYVKKGNESIESNSPKILVFRSPKVQRKGIEKRWGKYFVLSHNLPKTQFFEGETIDLVYYLYCKLPISGIQVIKEPQLKDAWEGGRTEKSEWRIAQRAGESFVEIPIYRRLFFPSQALEEIGAMEAIVETAIRKEKVRRNDPFEDFFNDDFFNDDFFGTSFERIRVLAEPIAIEVRKIPEEGKPIKFSGAVGQFRLNTLFQKLSPGQYQSTKLEFEIRGQGNLELVEAPALESPSECWEIYPPETQHRRFRDSTGKIVDELSLTYNIVALERGAKALPSFTFHYFDPEKARYQSLNSSNDTVMVKKTQLSEAGRNLSNPNLKALSLPSEGKVRKLPHFLIYMAPLLLLIVLPFQNKFLSRIQAQQKNRRGLAQRQQQVKQLRLDIGNGLGKAKSVDEFLRQSNRAAQWLLQSMEMEIPLRSSKKAPNSVPQKRALKVRESDKENKCRQSLHAILERNRKMQFGGAGLSIDINALLENDKHKFEECLSNLEKQC